MRDDQHRFLMLLGQLPARLTAEETAWVINCQLHDLPILMACRLLKPLGSPAANSTKYFATSDILELAKDRTWLVKMTQAIYRRRQDQNAKGRRSESESNNGHAQKSEPAELPLASA
jgi:hypothetical protein